MVPLAGLFSEVQDEVIADGMFEKLVGKDTPGLVELNGQSGLNTAVYVDGSQAGGAYPNIALHCTVIPLTKLRVFSNFDLPVAHSWFLSHSSSGLFNLAFSKSKIENTNSLNVDWSMPNLGQDLERTAVASNFFVIRLFIRNTPGLVFNYAAPITYQFVF